jgi:hypothetical protein
MTLFEILLAIATISNAVALYLHIYRNGHIR